MTEIKLTNQLLVLIIILTSSTTGAEVVSMSDTLNKLLSPYFEALEGSTLIRQRKIIEPECDEDVLLQQTTDQYQLKLRTMRDGCSFTLRSERSMTVSCPGVPSLRSSDGHECDTVTVTQAQTLTQLYCNGGDAPLLSVGGELGGLRSELTFITCNIFVEDGAEERQQGAVPPEQYTATPQLCPETCGLKPSLETPQTRIVGGDPVKIGELPWQGLVVGRTASDMAVSCGASVLNSRFMLSAAHCFRKDSSFLSFTRVLVILGVDELNEESMSFAQFLLSEKIIVHPGYQDSLPLNDIALIQLAWDINWTPYLAPVCLPEPDQTYDGYEATVSGYGMQYEDYYGYVYGVEGSERTLSLLQTTVPVLSYLACSILYVTTYLSLDRYAHLCTKGFNTGACMGDSGGPVTVLNSTTGRVQQVGVVSWGIGCADPLYPTVHTRVGSYREWISETVRASEANATCGVNEY